MCNWHINHELTVIESIEGKNNPDMNESNDTKQKCHLIRYQTKLSLDQQVDLIELIKYWSLGFRQVFEKTKEDQIS